MTDTTTAAEDDGFTPKPWLFLGVSLSVSSAFSNDPEPRVKLQPIGPHGLAEGEPIAFGYDAKAYRHLQPGTVYLFPTRHTDGTRIKFGVPADAKPYQDDAERQAIVISDRAARVALAAGKDRAKLAKADLDLDAILKPLRPAYAKCRTADSALAFELLVIAALRRRR